MAAIGNFSTSFNNVQHSELLEDIPDSVLEANLQNLIDSTTNGQCNAMFESQSMVDGNLMLDSLFSGNDEPLESLFGNLDAASAPLVQDNDSSASSTSSLMLSPVASDDGQGQINASNLELTSDPTDEYVLPDLLPFDNEMAAIDEVYKGSNSTLFADVASDSNLVRQDLMWSQPVSMGQNNRKREVSLTLSECAERLANEIDVNSFLEDSALLVTGSNGASVTPSAVIHPYTNSTGSSIDASDQDISDEEIDVVSDCSSSTISNCSSGYRSPVSVMKNSTRFNSLLATPPSAKTVSKFTPSIVSRPASNIRAGRSLLRNPRKPQDYQQKKRQSRLEMTPKKNTGNNNNNNNASNAKFMTAQPSPQTILQHMNGDHCYFAVSQTGVVGGYTSAHSPKLPPTPNDSSDDEDIFNGNSKVAEKAPISDDDISKFRFTCKFRSKSPNFRVPLPGESIEDIECCKIACNAELGCVTKRNRNKRKSAMLNTHCPSPSPKKRKVEPTVVAANTIPSIKPVASSNNNIVKPTTTTTHTRRNSGNNNPVNGNKKNHSNQEQKCREIRDLHNSMERARRVDLRNNFDQLKVEVPELREADKASKLTILKKSADYCKSLDKAERLLLEEKEREMAKKAMYQKKLLHYFNIMSAGPI